VNTSALLVIDAQKIYTTKDSEMYCKDSTGTIKRVNSLIDLYQESRMPIIFIRHIHNNDGSDLGRMFDFSGEAEGHAGGHVGLDEAGDDVDRRALRSEDEMDADGASHLREARDGLFDIGAVEHHEVGELVDDDDDVGKRLVVFAVIEE